MHDTVRGKSYSFVSLKQTLRSPLQPELQKPLCDLYPSLRLSL